jgi:hypothetical protein
MAKVKIVTNTPGAAQKAVNFADIKGQGKIPYKGGETMAEAPMDVSGGTARGMGAAKRGGSYKGCM